MSAITSTGTANSSQTLSEGDFLQLLVSQLTSQDPLNPESNTDFAAQMAQFSALQESQTMASSLSTMTTQQQLLQANALIGQTVSLTNSDGSTASGAVSGVQINSGTPQILVNGTAYNLSQLLSISPTATQTTTQ